jgi:hypothetical protein
MRKQVSEKTLELNISAELLQIIRGIPGCESAFWVGLKQDQEARWGMDELIRNVPRGYHMVLQFKSPKALPRDSLPYFFTINDRQNNNLLRLAQARPQAVYYVFPHYNSLSRLGNVAPGLLDDTWFLRVFDLNDLGPSSNTQGTHVVESQFGNVTIRSDPYQVQTVKVEKIRQMLLAEHNELKGRLLNHTLLEEWIKEVSHKTNKDRRVIGQLFRGFLTVCIPMNS